MTTVATEWETVVGLEVHCELRTETKLFCGCRNSFGAEPNTNICPVCLGLPGSLPVLNRMAVEFAMRIGTALHAQIQTSIFHRKNYFYPDMPKDYQISQYDEPINVGGWLELPGGKRIGIVRAHIEEDTGKTTHVGGGGRIHEAIHSLVDYNRAGVPLVEIVSEPDVRGADEARAYVDELRAILVATGVSDGKMEEGSLRVDANVSVRPAGSVEFGTRCEIKNMNSLRSLGRAIQYEAARQVELLAAGQRVVQETRHWNEADGKTHAMRSKEEAYDYRYFPEPDLVPLAPSDDWVASVARSMGLLPAQRRARVAAAAALSPDDEPVVTVVRLNLDAFVMAAADAGADPALAVKRLTNEVAANLDQARHLDPDAFSQLIRLEGQGELTTSQARDVLKHLLEHGGDPAAIAKELGFEAMAAEDVKRVLDEIIAANPAEWTRFVAGEEQLQGLFIGKVKVATGGKADLKAVAGLLRQRRTA
ncbi:MAG TPA: Asp-tRNA(Asn)/Glu-tRNA(Gln) amidotransferase subunit GatB, partial [Acidimicrobiales bacterium]|nr:Asp-tRNA(Asn)/Glu-tRNA(Gln) amidotransferase subunit GatB [Acidimicrobiales bacterium]